ncbi:MAG: hypothetical protein GX568_09940 [Candidatus Gastranaerophilales bacterium]|nr:hypothetical protein [Candidatus Gastranaerophilales bacterium]
MTEKEINIEEIKKIIIHPRIGEILIQHKKITLDQLGVALDEQARNNIPIGRILIDKGFISENELVELLSLQKNIDKLLEESYSELERLKNGPQNKSQNKSI